MEPTGHLRVSDRGQMSLPAATRKRWSLDDGGSVGYLDLGDAIVIIPDGIEDLRSGMLAAITDEMWVAASSGFGDEELASQ